MSTAVQSPGGFFVQSPGGVRSAVTGLVIVDESVWTCITLDWNFGTQNVFLCPASTFYQVPAFIRRPSFGFSPSDIFSVAVSDISLSNPAVVTTSSAHYLTNLMKVNVAGHLGMPELPVGPHDVNVLSDTVFELVGIDSTLYTPYISGGTVTLLNVTTPWLQGRFTGMLSGATFDWFLNCEVSGDEAFVYDELGQPGVTGETVIEAIGQSWRILFGGIASESEAPIFQLGEPVRISLFADV